MAMAKWPKSTMVSITGDTLVTSHPCWLHGLVVLASAGGGDVTLYEGQDTTSGVKLGRFEGANNISNPIAFDPPVWCERGLYVDVGSNITEVDIHYTPQYLNQPQPETP